MRKDYLRKYYFVLVLFFPMDLFSQKYPSDLFPYRMDVFPEFLSNDTIIQKRKIKEVYVYEKFDTSENHLIEKYIFKQSGYVDTIYDYKRQLIKIVYGDRENNYTAVFDMKTGKRDWRYSAVGSSEDGEKDSTIYQNGKIDKIIRNKNKYEVFAYNEFGFWTGWYRISNLVQTGWDSLGFQIYDTTRWDTLSFVENEYWNGKILKKKVGSNLINSGDLLNYYDKSGNLLEHNYSQPDYYDDSGNLLDNYAYNTVTIKTICEYNNNLRTKEIWSVNGPYKKLKWIYSFEYVFFDSTQKQK